jgi:anti-sigma B factor antagonist
MRTASLAPSRAPGPVPPQDEGARARAEQAVMLGRLSMRSQREGDLHTLELAGEMDLANAAEVERELLRVDRGDAGAILVDLCGLRFIDSTGIRVLVRAGARSRADGGRLVLQRAPRPVLRVLRMAGVADLLPLAG